MTVMVGKGTISVSEIRIISSSLIEDEGPGVNDGLLIEVIHGGPDAILEFLFGCDTDMTQDGAGEFGEEASTRLSQEPCVGVKVNSKRCAGCSATQALVSFEM